MKAAYITQPGPPESIVYGDLPTPRPGPKQCLVKTGAVSVNPVDTYIRSGAVPMPLPSPFVVGCDLAGKAIDRTVSDFHARVVQHECDHLQGILYPMRISDMWLFGFTEVLFPDLPIVDE